MEDHNLELAADNPSSSELLPIGEVSRLTGVNAVTLRAWQRRFGLVIPERTPKGHRLYTAKNIQQIHEINAWLAKGVAISKVKPLLISSAKAIDVASVQSQSSDFWHEQILALNTAFFELDQLKFHQILDEALGLYPFQLVKQKLLQAWFAQLMPLLEPRLDVELLLAWLDSELASRIGGRLSVAGLASSPQIALVRLPYVTSQKNTEPTLVPSSSLTNRLYCLALLLELADLRVSVVNLGVQHISSLGLINNRLKVDALVLLPEANHSLSKQTELQMLLETKSLACYLVGPFAPTLTTLSDYIAPSVTEIILQITAAKQQHKKQYRRQKNQANAALIEGESADEH